MRKIANFAAAKNRDDRCIYLFGSFHTVCPWRSCSTSILSVQPTSRAYIPLLSFFLHSTSHTATLGLPYKYHDSNFWNAYTSGALVNKIRTRQTTFFGHVMRREKLEHLITTGMMIGKRSRGKQREKMTDGLVKWLGAGKVVEILKATRDRGIWKDMIANAIKHGTGWWWWWYIWHNRMAQNGLKTNLWGKGRPTHIVHNKGKEKNFPCLLCQHSVVILLPWQQVGYLRDEP